MERSFPITIVALLALAAIFLLHPATSGPAGAVLLVSILCAACLPFAAFFGKRAVLVIMIVSALLLGLLFLRLLLGIFFQLGQ